MTDVLTEEQMVAGANGALEALAGARSPLQWRDAYAAAAALAKPRPEPELSPVTIVGDPAALFAALAKAQGNFAPLIKNRTVQVRSDKGSYTFDYATLDAVFDSVRGALASNGLAIIQPFSKLGARGVLATWLTHASGARLETSVEIKVPEKIQELGSLLTYVKRYSVSSLLGLSSEEDDDGNAADGNQRTAQDRSRPPQPPPATKAAPPKPEPKAVQPEAKTAPPKPEPAKVEPKPEPKPVPKVEPRPEPPLSAAQAEQVMKTPPEDLGALDPSNPMDEDTWIEFETVRKLAKLDKPAIAKIIAEMAVPGINIENFGDGNDAFGKALIRRISRVRA